MTDKDFFENIQIGETRRFAKTVTEADVVTFAGISGDFNPMHMNAEYAKEGIFGERIAHGMFTLGLVSTTVAAFPGDIIYMTQNAKFLKPVRLGDTIEAVTSVKEKGEKFGLHLEMKCYNQKGEIVLEGDAKIKAFPHRPKEK